MLPAKGRYRISYEDQRGLRTERDIEVKRVHECGGKYAIDAHCFLRNAHRSFLGERIEKTVNLPESVFA
jgi:predicted DNA-binding transcriptional regulator YafY